MADRHVSRWRLPAEAAATPSAPTAVSLRYLDEFVRKLQCAPRLLEHQIFPDAKEITESMGLFNAVRRYIITSDSDLTRTAKEAESELADGIVVVGDGNTPRSAAMFAYRLKQWKCYSIDPAMETSSTRASSWGDVANLVVIRNKIENVHIKLRRAVVVLVHAHVTLSQALGAVECDELVGFVTMPCCNWYGKQEELFGRPPSVVYDDFSILSDHRELRVWVDPRGDRSSSGPSEQLALDQSSAMAKGCVRKEFVADFGVSTHGSDGDGSMASGGKSTQRKSKETTRATVLFHEVLGALDESKPPASSTRMGVQAPVISAAQSEAAAAIIETQIENKSARLLILSGDAPPQGSDVVRSLLQRGFTNIYTLQLSAEARDVNDESDTLHATVVQLGLASPEDAMSISTVADLHSVPTTSDTAADASSYATSIVEPGASKPLTLFDCIVDASFVYRSLASQPKKTSGLTFERIMALILSMTNRDSGSLSPRLISLSPRKDWRKTEFLANERLQLAFSSTSIAADKSSGTTGLFVYAGSPTSSALSTPASDGDEPAEIHQTKIREHKKQLALHLKKALEDDYFAMTQGLDAALLSPADVQALAVDGSSTRGVRVRGVVQHLRRFTTGPSFFSIAAITPASSSSSFRDHLQIALDPHRLTHWHDPVLSLDAVIRLLHKGDHVECVGEMARNAQQQPVLRLDALRFLASEFQAYQ